MRTEDSSAKPGALNFAFLRVSKLLHFPAGSLWLSIQLCLCPAEIRVFKGKLDVFSESGTSSGKAVLKTCIKLGCKFGLGKTCIICEIQGSFLKWLKIWIHMVTAETHAEISPDTWLIPLVPAHHIRVLTYPRKCMFPPNAWGSLEVRSADFSLWKISAAQHSKLLG